MISNMISSLGCEPEFTNSKQEGLEESSEGADGEIGFGPGRQESVEKTVVKMPETIYEGVGDEEDINYYQDDLNIYDLQDEECMELAVSEVECERMSY